MRSARTLHVLVQLAIERVVDRTRLAGGRIALVLPVFEQLAGIFQHVHHAGARPWPEPDKHIVHISERIKPQHGRVHPAIDRDIRRAQPGRLARAVRSASAAALCRGIGGARLLGRKPKAPGTDRECHCHHAGRKSGHKPWFVLVHRFLHSISLVMLPECARRKPAAARDRTREARDACRGQSHRELRMM